jgi:hypothetical protein
VGRWFHAFHPGAYAVHAAAASSVAGSTRSSRLLRGTWYPAVSAKDAR